MNPGRPHPLPRSWVLLRPAALGFACVARAWLAAGDAQAQRPATNRPAAEALTACEVTADAAMRHSMALRLRRENHAIDRAAIAAGLFRRAHMGAAIGR